MKGKHSLTGTKLIQLLQTFSNSEMTDFGRFVASPFHNESPLIKELFAILKKHHPEFEHDDFTRENIYKKLYGSGKYDDKRMRDRFSDMLKLAEDYLAIVDMKKDTVRMKRHTMNQFAARKLKIHFDKKYNEISTSLKKTKIKNNHYFYDEYLLHKDKEYPFSNERVALKYISLYDNMKTEIEYFLRFFVSKMLKYYSMTRSMENHVKFEFDYSMYEAVMDHVSKNDFRKYPAIMAFYYVLRLCEGKDDLEYYYKLKELVMKNAGVMELRDIRLIFAELFNNAQKLYLAGNDNFKRERFDLVKLELRSGSHETTNGWMERNTFTNYIMLALINGEIADAVKFIKNEKNKLPPETRESAELFAEGIVGFYKGEFQIAAEKLSLIKTKNKDFSFYSLVKIPLSKSYYELGEYENVLTLIDSIRHYMTSNPMIPEGITGRFLLFMNMLYKLTHAALEIDDGKAEYGVARLKRELAEIPFNSLSHNKEWLTEKIVELEKKNKRKR